MRSAGRGAGAAQQQRSRTAAERKAVTTAFRGASRWLDYSGNPCRRFGTIFASQQVKAPQALPDLEDPRMRIARTAFLLVISRLAAAALPAAPLQLSRCPTPHSPTSHR
jgi:hypothetical protein